jgi:hypothetical protein
MRHGSGTLISLEKTKFIRFAKTAARVREARKRTPFNPIAENLGFVPPTPCARMLRAVRLISLGKCRLAALRNARTSVWELREAERNTERIR